MRTLDSTEDSRALTARKDWHQEDEMLKRATPNKKKIVTQLMAEINHGLRLRGVEETAGGPIIESLVSAFADQIIKLENEFTETIRILEKSE